MAKWIKGVPTISHPSELVLLETPVLGETIEGYIAGLSTEFALVQFMDGHRVDFDGFCCIPVKYIRRYKTMKSSSSFIPQALALKGLFPSAPNFIELSGYRGMMESIKKHYPILTLYEDIRYKGCCFIGEAIEIADDWLMLKEIDPTGKWDHVRRYMYKNITRVQFDRAYENALYLVARNHRRDDDDFFRESK